MWHFERRLLLRAAKGDREAGDEIARRYYESVFAFALALTHDRETAQDLTQATFAACWTSMSGFEGRSSLRTWIHRIAYRQYAAWLQAQKRPDWTGSELRANPSEGQILDTLWLHEAIETLPEELRVPFVLFYVQELSCREIAQILGIPKGTVLSRLHTARTRLRAILPEPVGAQNYEMSKTSV